MTQQGSLLGTTRETREQGMTGRGPSAEVPTWPTSRATYLSSPVSILGVRKERKSVQSPGGFADIIPGLKISQELIV